MPLQETNLPYPFFTPKSSRSIAGAKLLASSSSPLGKEFDDEGEDEDERKRLKDYGQGNGRAEEFRPQGTWED